MRLLGGPKGLKRFCESRIHSGSSLDGILAVFRSCSCVCCRYAFSHDSYGACTACKQHFQSQEYLQESELIVERNKVGFAKPRERDLLTKLSEINQRIKSSQKQINRRAGGGEFAGN